MLVPWLVLVVYTQADERKAAIANVNDDAMRLIRIVTSNQGGPDRGCAPVLNGVCPAAADPHEGCGRMQCVPGGNAEGVPAVFEYCGGRSQWRSGLQRASFRTPINVADRAYFKMALQMHDFAIGDYQIGRITNLPAISYGYRSWTLRTSSMGVRPRSAEPQLADGGARERRVSAGRHHGGDRSQWNGARSHAPMPAIGIASRCPNRKSSTSCSAKRDGGLFESRRRARRHALWPTPR